MKKPESITVKTGNPTEFMDHVKNVMRSIDQKKALKPSHTLIFEEPAEMLHCLSEAKLRLIHYIRKHPDTITSIAKAIKRDRAAVCRDVKELEKFGLVKTHQEINPGHGRHKIVEMVATQVKLEAYI